MAERGANIDLIFRNGLKDYEVLPPPEVLNNILPVIKTKQRSYVFLKSAALIAGVMTLSFVTYQLSKVASIEISNPEMALNSEAVSPDISPSLARTLNRAVKVNPPVKNIVEPKLEIVKDNVVGTDNVLTASPEPVYLQETSSLSMNIVKASHGPYLTSLKTSLKSTFKTPDPVFKYFPEAIPVKITDRWSIAAMASPTYYSRFNSGSNEISHQLMSSEKPLISYSGGVAFAYKVNKRFSVQSGLYYSSLGQVIDDISSYSGFQSYSNTAKGDHNFEVLTSNGTIFTKNADVFILASGPIERVQTNLPGDEFNPKKANLQYISSSLRQNFSYLELPILVRYKIIDKAVDFNLIGGMSYNLLVNNSVYTPADGSKYPIGETQGVNQLSVSSSLGMGMEYNLSDKLSLNVEPTFRYYLNPFNGTTSSSVHPYSFGIFSGVSYRF